MDVSARGDHRFHFVFTVACHDLSPQFPMGLALLIVILQTLAPRTGDSTWPGGVRFRGRISGIHFLIRVVTGIPMEFQVGTSRARFLGAWASGRTCTR